MFSNTTAIDIAIGLIFVYLIYSLLINIIAEMLSTWLGIRARLLRQGIDNLLNDKNPQKGCSDFWGWMKDIFLVEPKEFKFSNSGKFYKEETIRSLAKRGENDWYSFRNTKPSYISKEMYSRTMLNMFNRRGRGVNEWSRIVFSVETNALHFEPDTNRQFQDMLTASDGQFELFQMQLQASYSEMMDRVNGWYKRKIGLMIFWIGLLLCISSNIDTIAIVKTLANNPELRKELVERATAAIKDSSAISKIMQTRTDSIDAEQSIKALNSEIYYSLRMESVMAAGWNYEKKTQIIPTNSTNKIKINAIILSYETCRNEIHDIEKRINSIERKDSLATLVTERNNLTVNVQGSLNSLSKILNKDIDNIEKIKKNSGYIEVLRNPTFCEKVWFIICQLSPLKRKLWGLIITALALSLGANFWFDLLKKLVALRGAGVKPEEKSPAAAAPNSSDVLKSKGLFIDNPDPIVKAISDNRKYWESIPGVIAINKAMKSGANKEVIEIIIDKARYVDYRIPDKLKVIIGDTPIIVDIVKTPGEIGVLLNGTLNLSEGNIYHPSTDQKGSPAGIVRNRRTTNSAILTCSHVVQFNDDPFIHPFREETKLHVMPSDGSGVVNLKFGNVSNLVISSFVDASIIDIDNQDIIDLANKDKNDQDFKIQNLTRPNAISNYSVNSVFVIHTPRKKIEVFLNDSDIDYTFYQDTSIEKRFRNIIRFWDKTSNGVTLPTVDGDSGSLITDSNGNPVAMLFAHAKVDGRGHIFGIKMTDIFEVMQLETLN